MTHTEILIRLALALIVGGIAGLDREKSRQWAGFRTHILVAVGSCVASITSILLFEQYKYLVNIDPGRISAQVLSGIGFLGAGAILKTSNSIRGLTTAAGIWVVASIGLAVGFGYYFLSIITLVFMMVTLKALKFFENKISSNKSSTINISTSNLSQATTDILEICQQSRVKIKDIDKLNNSENEGNIKLSVLYSSKYTFRDITDKFKKIKGIKSVEFID